jgi:hypothetical protein
LFYLFILSVLGIDFQLDFSAESTCITYPTLSLTCFEEEDNDFALVKKIGAGDSAASVFPTVVPGYGEDPANDSEKSQCVFHVAQQMSISMPVTGENLEIRDRATTKIFLTSGSDEIEAHALRSELLYSKPPVRRNHRTSEAAELSQAQFGPGWFTWRQWKVDKGLIEEFSSYIGKA